MVIAYFIEDKSYILWIRNKNYLPIVLICNLVWLLSGNLTGFYEDVLNKDSVRTYRGVIKTFFLFVSLICFTIIVLIGTKAYFITREYLFYSLASFGFLLSLWKIVFLTIRMGDRKQLLDPRNVIIIGGGRIGTDLFNFFEQNPDRGYKITGFFDDDPDRVPDKSLYLGNTSECISYVVENKVDEMFCTLSSAEGEKIERLMLDCDKNLIRFKFIPDYYNYGVKPTLIQSFGHIPVISVRPEPLENMFNRMFKRLFDIAFSLFIIFFVLTWLFPILALIILIESRGPVLFIQVRSGRDNHPFKCYKFRSMRVNNESDRKQASRNDKRITKVGAFIRRTSIDELPQFFNVLIGNMSVVGPRPHMISHTEQYAKLIDTFMVRHFLKPGITGWAQIKGLRGETNTTEAMMERVEADVWYLENWSFLLDLKIIFLTIWNSIRGDKNAF
jgi:Undecaprenyl-phosphate glucose phosphotransferase